MAKKNQKKTKSKIVSVQHGSFFTNRDMKTPTIEEIIEESGTSKGSFYHYFEGKDALLGSLAYMMDEKYEEFGAEQFQRMPIAMRWLSLSEW